MQPPACPPHTHQPIPPAAYTPHPPAPLPDPPLQVAYDSWHIVWAVTGVAGFAILAFPEALNIASILRERRRSGATPSLRSGSLGKESPGASDDSASKPVSSYTATAI